MLPIDIPKQLYSFLKYQKLIIIIFAHLGSILVKMFTAELQASSFDFWTKLVKSLQS